MSKELDRELKKIRKAMRIENENENPTVKVIFSKLSFVHIFREIENRSFINNNGDLIYLYKLNKHIGARFKGKPYSISNPIEIMKHLEELEYERNAERLIRFNSQQGYYKNGEEINPNELSSILETAEIVTPPEYLELLEYIDKAYNDKG